MDRRGSRTSTVEVERLLNGNGALYVVLGNGLLQLFFGGVEAIDVGLVVLLVVQLHNLSTDSGLECLQASRDSAVCMHRASSLQNTHAKVVGQVRQRVLTPGGRNGNASHGSAGNGSSSAGQGSAKHRNGSVVVWEVGDDGFRRLALKRWRSCARESPTS